ncbi:hypothetical protein RUM43_009362 [Polyplax serrata]|uniref:Uncharacterized protein n=1 Tax=Polyplax serrata TaxID=468196 RepID=A0AAN8S4H3_POLSC
MTYISRGTRIIVPRWLDECDAEYELRAYRTRSDGRLKRHASCDDLRAWVNNNCINHEYLVDLMSNGEGVGNSHVRLYGRYIPVPALLKFYQGLNHEQFENDANKGNSSIASGRTWVKGKEDGGTNSGTTALGSTVHSVRSYSDAFSSCTKDNDVEDACPGRDEVDQTSCNRSDEDQTPCSARDGDDDLFDEGDENLLKAQCEKFLLEKKFFQCRSLLCKAVGKLEKIDRIICKEEETSENARNEQIELAFQTAKSACNCPTMNSISRPSVKKVRDPSKCSEVLRRIADLKQRLKVITDKREEVDMQLKKKMSGNHQVTELYNRNDDLKSKSLQQKLECLVAKKGELLMEFSEALNSLKRLKKSTSGSRMSFKSRGSCPNGEEYSCESRVPCVCGCQNFDSYNSLLSDTSQDDYSVGNKQAENDYLDSSDVVRDKFSNGRRASTTDDAYNDESLKYREDTTKNSGRQNRSNVSTPNPLSAKMPTEPSSEVDGGRKEESLKVKKKSKLKFVCPKKSVKSKWPNGFEFYDGSDNPFTTEQKQEVQQPNKQQPEALTPDKTSRHQWHSTPIRENTWRQQGQQYTERSLQQQRQYNELSEQRERRNGNVAYQQNPRPYTSPTAKGRSSSGKIPQRKIKSETTMEEIEKALRNYEQRLKCLDYLEDKIVKMQQRILEDSRQKQEWLKQRVQREKSSKEITNLCSENSALRKTIRQLIVISDNQMKKIECLKTSKRKLKESACEAQELKKELCEYQDGFEEQKKQINMLQNCLAQQRTEIEKLTHLINNKMDNNSLKNKAYSLESVAMSPPRVTRPCVQDGRKFVQSSEEESCGCDDWHQQEVVNRQRKSGNACCPPQTIKRRGRGVNYDYLVCKYNF